ncbi:MAG TPA: hypothetical protein VNL77_03330, partial [Roseiflexaceae bacterium]|nr:hypothetical protein [Roseiflexaceae bacterium]
MYRLAKIATLFVVGALLLGANLRVQPALAGAEQTYLVLYKGSTVGADAITRAGGTLVAAYNQIGVAVARSA